MTYIPSVNGTIDPNNSSSAVLLANGTFVGTPTNVMVYASLSVSVISDVASTTNGLVLQGSSDGLNWDLTQTYSVTPNLIQTCEFPVNLAYFRLTYSNSGSSQSTFRLQTILHPTINTISVINNNSPVNNLSLPSSILGDPRFVMPTPVAQFDFVYGLNSNLVTTSTTSSGSVNTENNLATLSVNESGDSATLQSNINAPYRTGQGGLVRFSGIYNGGSGSLQIIGVGNAVNGFFFALNNGTFGILYRNSITSIDTQIPHTSWNVDVMDGTGPSGMTLNYSMGNVYQITYNCLDFGNVNFYIFDPQFGNFVLVHTINYANNYTNTITGNPSLPIYASITSIGGSGQLQIASGSQFIDGLIPNSGQTYSYDTSTNINTADTNVMTLQNNPIFNSVTNQSQLKLATIAIGGTGGNVYLLRIYENAVINTPSYNSVNPNSMAWVDTSGTLASGGTYVFNMVGNNNTIDVSDLNLTLNAGSTYTFSITSTTNTNVILAVTWSEFT